MSDPRTSLISIQVPVESKTKTQPYQKKTKYKTNAAKVDKLQSHDQNFNKCYDQYYDVYHQVQIELNENSLYSQDLSDEIVKTLDDYIEALVLFYKPEHVDFVKKTIRTQIDKIIKNKKL